MLGIGRDEHHRPIRWRWLRCRCVTLRNDRHPGAGRDPVAITPGNGPTLLLSAHHGVMSTIKRIRYWIPACTGMTVL